MVVAVRSIAGAASFSLIRCVGCSSWVSIRRMHAARFSHLQFQSSGLSVLKNGYICSGHMRNNILLPFRHSDRQLWDFVHHPGRGSLVMCRSVITQSYCQLNGAIHGYESEADVRKQLEREKIYLRKYQPGQYNSILCPKCEGGQSRELSLAVRISADGDSAVWFCFRGKCGWKGTTKASDDSTSLSLSLQKQSEKAFKNNVNLPLVATKLTEESLGLSPLCDELKVYFACRGISEVTLTRNGVKQLNAGGEVAIAFPYWKGGKIVGCKYRSVDNQFWQEEATQRVFYGLDDIKDAEEIIIVEGETDKLSMEEAGFSNCVSVPNGAPFVQKGAILDIQERSFGYIWNCKEYLEKAVKIILATDADPLGQVLSEELARRLGRERCWRVNWLSFGFKNCKDANEVLRKYGKQYLQDMIAKAEPYPVRGLFRFNEFFKEIDDYYYLRLGDELGVSTGWHGLDEFYRVVPGELTLVTGVPNSGKSEWIDALLCNLNSSKNWTFALCSMENKVREHGRKLLEKHVGKPFFDAPYADSKPRMTTEEFEAGKQWLNRSFYLIRCNNDELPSVTWVLDLAKAAVMRHGIRGLVIDPYNELDHRRPSNQTETEYVSQMLTKLKRFAQLHDCHVWFVAHPKQLHGWDGDAPNLYDISGSAHFINKCDNGLVIHRNRDPDKGPIDQVQVLVRKVRNKAAGTIGDAFLYYDRVNGRFKDVEGFGF